MPSKPLNNLKRRLAKGISSWLTFEFACDRGYLFSEYYLAHAVGQLLRASDDDVRAEVPHPTLAVPGKTGRPPSIDFVAYEKKTVSGAVGAVGPPTLAVETKWAGYSDVTAGALAWDAFRLAAFSRSTGAPGLLVFAGIKKKVKALFQSTSFHRPNAGHSGTAVPLLPGRDGPMKFVLSRNDLSATAVSYFQERTKTAPSGAVPDACYFEKPHYSPSDGSQAIAFEVYVWEVRAI